MGIEAQLLDQSPPEPRHQVVRCKLDHALEDDEADQEEGVEANGFRILGDDPLIEQRLDQRHDAGLCSREGEHGYGGQDGHFPVGQQIAHDEPLEG